MYLEQIDEIAFNVLREKNHELLESLTRGMDMGLTARQVERRVLWKFGRSSILAQICISAAYHYESIRKQEKGNESK